MKQIFAYRSRQHLVPSLQRVQSSRSFVPRSTRTPSFRNPFQARTASCNVELPGTFEGVPQADTQRLPSCDEKPMSAQAYREMMQRYSRQNAAFEAQMEELRQRQVANSEAIKEALQHVPLEVGRMRRAAVQILVRACGKQEHQTTPSALFAQLVEAKDSGLQQVADSLGMELEQLGEEAEAMLAHHYGGQVQLHDMEDLDYEVYAVQLWITPALKQRFSRECHFMEAYEAIKQVVPERFT